METLKIFIEITGLVTLFLMFFYGMAFRSFEHFSFPKGYYSKVIDLFEINPNSAKGKKIINKYRIIPQLRHHLNYLTYKKGFYIDKCLLFRAIAKTPYEKIKKYNENFLKMYLDLKGINFNKDDLKDYFKKQEIEREIEKGVKYYEKDIPALSAFNTGILLISKLYIVWLTGYEIYIIFTSVIFSIAFFLLAPFLF
jgi:hypothetical protein